MNLDAAVTLSPGRVHTLARVPSHAHPASTLAVLSAGVAGRDGRTPAAVENTSENRVVETRDWAGRADVIRRDDGVYVLSYRRGTHHGNVADASLHVHFSEDEGRTWGPANETLDGDTVEGFPYAIEGKSMGYGILERTRDGDLLVFVGRKRTDSQALDGTGVLRSTDGGRTWADEGKADFAGREDDDGCYPSDSFVHPRTGDVYLGLFHVPENDRDRQYRYALARSIDDGNSWEYVAAISDPEAGDPAGGEHGIEYLGDGRVVCLGRTVDDSETVLYRSDDLGESWHGPRGLADQLGIVNKPRLYSEGAITDGLAYTAGALFLCGRQRVVSRAVAQGEHNAVAVSTDGGETWTRPARGKGYGDGGYSGLTRRADGTLYQVGYGGEGNVYPCDVLDLTHEFTPELAVEVRDTESGETLYSGHVPAERGDPLATLDVGGRPIAVELLNRSAREVDATAWVKLAYRE